MKSEINEIFGEELGIEIVNLIGEWIYQISKWTLNMHYDDQVKDFVSNKNYW